MKTFVTGGTGFLGGHLVRRLVESGHKVTVLARETSNTEKLKPLGVKLTLDTSEASESDVVYHVAGVLGRRGNTLHEYASAHVALPYRILQSLSEGQLFVYVSSAWVLKPTKPYEQTKVEGERIVRAFTGDGRARGSIIRPGFIYGPGDMHHYPLFKAIARLGRFCPIMGSGKNLVCPTYVDDVVDFIYHAAEGEYTIAGSPVTMRGFMRAIAKAVGVSKPFFCLPAIFKADFFATERVFPCSVPTTPLEEGLKNTVEWYKENGYL